MSTKAARGTKRTCQRTTCGARFYDLMRDPIICPICGWQYVVASAGPGAVIPVAEPVARTSDFDGDKVDDAPEVTEEALAEIEGGDEPVVVADDETFLEEEEDSTSDNLGIVGGGEEPEEQ